MANIYIYINLVFIQSCDVYIKYITIYISSNIDNVYVKDLKKDSVYTFLEIFEYLLKRIIYLGHL